MNLLTDFPNNSLGNKSSSKEDEDEIYKLNRYDFIYNTRYDISTFPSVYYPFPITCRLNDSRFLRMFMCMLHEKNFFDKDKIWPFSNI